MQDDITELYYSKDPICAEGREFLASRKISIPQAIKAGICSKNGVMYFLYFRDNQPVRWKSRNIKNKKDQKWSSLKDEDKDSFKTPFFSHFKGSPSKDIMITEGELDCVTLSQLGASNCVSLPNGASSVEKTFRENYEYLQSFDTIYIAFDMDKPGMEAAKKAMAMINPKKFRRINFPDAKDANEWLQKNEFLEYSDLEKLMSQASRAENPSITNATDLSQDYRTSIDLGISTGWAKLDKLLGGVRLGEVTVISADTGAGKTTFCINFFKNLADQGQGIWLNSYEMNPKMVYRKLASIVLQKHLKYQEFTQEDCNRFDQYLHKHNVLLNTSNSVVNISELRKQIEMASLAYGAKYILIDHLDYIHANGTKESKLENIEEAVREIHVLAMEFKVGIILVVHPKQLPDKHEVSMHDLKGSSAIKQYADNIIVVTRMDRIDPNDLLRVKVRVWKNRLCGREGAFFLRYIPETDGYTETF